MNYRDVFGDISNGFFYESVRLLPKQQIELHRQASWELSLVITGSGKRIVGDTTCDFMPGEVVLVPPEMPHCWLFDPRDTDEEGRIENITILLERDFLMHCAGLLPAMRANLERLMNIEESITFGRSKNALMGKIMKDMESVSDADRVPMLFRLINLIATSNTIVIGRQQKEYKETDRLKEIRTYVICNLKREITLDDVVKHVRMNRSAFCVFFKRATGKTFVDYVNEMRVEAACSALTNDPGHSISEVCYEAGFNNVRYFNRIFKRYKNLTPSEYRQMCLEARP